MEVEESFFLFTTKNPILDILVIMEVGWFKGRPVSSSDLFTKTICRIVWCPSTDTFKGMFEIPRWINWANAYAVLPAWILSRNLIWYVSTLENVDVYHTNTFLFTFAEFYIKVKKLSKLGVISFKAAMTRAASPDCKTGSGHVGGKQKVGAKCECALLL